MTRKGWFLFCAISLFWGIPYLLIKIAVRELDPTVVVFARTAIAAIILLPIAAQRGVLSKLRGRWLLLAALSCLQITGPFLLISYGEQHITSSLTSLLIAAEPLLVALFALRFAPSERVNGLRLVGLLIGMLGVAALLGLDISGDRQRLLGAGLVLLATAAYAAAILLVRHPAISALPSLGVVTAECTIATVLLAPLAVTHLPTHLPSLPVIASLLVLGLVCTALAYLTLFALVAQVGASRSTVFTYVTPAVAVLLAVLILDEPLDAASILGFLLILIGSWLSTGGTLPSSFPRSKPTNPILD